jgi:hypothetical protein
MRFRVAIALLVALIVYLLWLSEADAFEPPNIRHHPGFPPNTPMVVKVGQTSTMTWEAIDSYGWPAWRDVVSRSLDTDSSDALSLGRVLNDYLRSENRGQITIRENRQGENPDLRHYAVPTAFLEAKCGTWATACIYGGVALPVPAYYKAASMITWGYASQAPVVKHETNHTIARACDQYQGGCPRASDGVWVGTVACTGNPDTLMDCGGAARTATRYDYDTFRLAYPASTAFLQVQVPDCGGPTIDHGNGLTATWNPCTGIWTFSNGYTYAPSNGWWGFRDVGFSPCDAFGLRQMPVLASTMPGLHSTFPWSLGYWVTVPGC